MGKTQRKSISKQTRFEIFKRDSFACQYCGRKAPDVLLEVDHINPISKGGDNNLLNLITSCFDCNRGKTNQKLKDTTVIDKQRQQLEKLQERREQIDMMFQWQTGLTDIKDYTIDKLSAFWTDATGYQLNESGLKKLKNIADEFSIDEITQAIKGVTDKFLEFDNSQATHDSIELAFSMVKKFCRVNKIAKDKPYIKDLLLVRWIIIKRFNLDNYEKQTIFLLLEKAFLLGYTKDDLISSINSAYSWNGWRASFSDVFIE